MSTMLLCLPIPAPGTFFFFFFFLINKSPWCTGVGSAFLLESLSRDKKNKTGKKKKQLEEGWDSFYHSARKLLLFGSTLMYLSMYVGQRDKSSARCIKKSISAKNIVICISCSRLRQPVHTRTHPSSPCSLLNTAQYVSNKKPA